MNNPHKIFGAIFSFIFVGLRGIAAVQSPSLPSNDLGRPGKPNIVILLADDLGWQDVKCYDIDEPSPMETPNIDALATKGVKFWQGYSPAPVCSPSRAAILSGDHPARYMYSISGGQPPGPGHIKHRLVSPFNSARIPVETVTIAEALKANGYVTGHSGKWHVSWRQNKFPGPTDQGFDYSRTDRGVQKGMNPDRLTGFATDAEDDPYRLDENGFPFDQTHADAMTFLKENHDKPFFLYYATWLVHTPIVMRSEQLLQKYVKKLGVELPPEAADHWTVGGTKGGQKNPFYCAMVEQLDYYLGQVFDYLETTEDPRWPGHKLIENTYIIFTSDNGGMEGGDWEQITDNYPLDRGKIHVEEGGIRVPFIITGPGIRANVESDVMVNGLDFYPTILSLTGTKKPQGKELDGCDISTLLLNDPTDPSLVKHFDGTVRDTMFWYFPGQQSDIRIGDYKMANNYGVDPPFELFRLYKSESGNQVRVDIEEAHNLAESMPEKVEEMNAILMNSLDRMGAEPPYFNPLYPHSLENKEKAPDVISYIQTGSKVVFTYRDNGARVDRASLIYTLKDSNGEWFKGPATVLPDMKVAAELPAGTTHYFINLIDENNFFVCYPAIVDRNNPAKKNVKYTERALKAASIR
jgi:arylsulfatase A-like enzyme